MRNSIDYVGTTTKGRHESSLRTVCKSRRLAMKRRRQRRASVADALGLNPTRERTEGNDLQQIAAEQLAIAAATNDVRQTDRAKRRTRKMRDSSDDRESLFDYTRSLFNPPVAANNRNQETTEESDPFEEPNTEDRRFIKEDDGASENDGEYVPTDPGEFTAENEWTPQNGRTKTAKRGYIYSLETKQDADYYGEKDTKEQDEKVNDGVDPEEKEYSLARTFLPSIQ